MANMMRNNSGYYDPTAFEAMSNIRREEKRKEKMKVSNVIRVYRGDIFNVKRNGNIVCGSEQDSERPAVIVSNNIGNEHSSIVEVVYLTTKEKNPLPTHVKIMCRVPSTALCEQISNISKERLGEYVRSCTDEEMAAIDRALMVSLGISNAPDKTETGENHIVDDLKMKLEGVERELYETNERFLNEKNCVHRLQKELDNKKIEISDLLGKLKEAGKQIPVFPVEIEKELLKAETQRDMYKELYEQMLEKMIG